MCRILITLGSEVRASKTEHGASFAQDVREKDPSYDGYRSKTICPVSLTMGNTNKPSGRLNTGRSYERSASFVQGTQEKGPSYDGELYRSRMTKEKIQLTMDHSTVQTKRFCFTRVGKHEQAWEARTKHQGILNN